MVESLTQRKPQDDALYHWTTEYRDAVYVDTLGPHMPEATRRQIVEFGKLVSAFILYESRHFANSEAIAMSERELRSRFGRRWFQLIGHLIVRGKAYRFGTSNKSTNYTRWLTVKPHIEALVIDAFVRDSWKPSELVRSDGKRSYANNNPMVGGKTKGKHGELHVPAKYNINSGNVRRYADVYADWLNAAESGIAPTIAVDEYRHRKAQRHAQYQFRHPDADDGLFISNWAQWLTRKLFAVRAIEAMTSAVDSDGQYLQTFAQTNKKPRWTGQGPASLQTVARELRYTALAGCWQYDIECCHHTILQWFAHQAGIKCPALDAYVLDRDVLRQDLADLLGHSNTESIKKALLIVIYGGRFQFVHDDNENLWALRALLGEQGQLALSEHDEFKRLHKELKRIFRHIINIHKPKNGHKGAIQNVLGQLLPATYVDDNGKTRKQNDAQKVAFILQAIECQALMAMIDASLTPLLPVHDGMVTRGQVSDISMLIDAMRDATGITFRVEEWHIESPKWLHD